MAWMTQSLAIIYIPKPGAANGLFQAGGGGETTPAVSSEQQHPHKGALAKRLTSANPF